MFREFLLTATAAISTNAMSAECNFTKWASYQDTTLYKHVGSSAYIFQSTNVKVDADGAPNAYHPDDIRLHCSKGQGFRGLDCPENAGYPNRHWWPSALVADPDNPSEPYVQTSSSAYPGYFVSQTSLFDKTKSKVDSARFVDARNIPYLVFPGAFNSMRGTGTLGDLGYAINISNGKKSPFIVADVGPKQAALGEMSIALAAALGGIDPNPRTGAGTPKGKILYVVFPKSSATPAWPLSGAQIAAQADRLLGEVGGLAALERCKSVG